MKINQDTARVADIGELVERVQNALDAARRLGVLSPTMVREGDDGPMIVKMGSSPIVVRELSPEQMQEAAAAVGIPWEEGFEERVIDVWASDERVDRDGDIVEQSWKFENFAKNPLVLWGHEWSAPPIGNAIQWGVEKRKDDDYDGPALRLTELFAPSDASPQAESVLRLAKAGFLRSGSVGFFPGKIIDVEDDDERAEVGLGKFGFILQENELVEHSHCSVPANPGALNILAHAKAAGGLSSTDIVAIRELARQDALIVGREDVWARMDSALRSVWFQLFPEVAVEDHKSIAQPIQQDSAVEKTGVYGKGDDDKETPPADGETPPADGETPPADGGETPPADGEAPPEEDAAKTADERITDLEAEITASAEVAEELAKRVDGVENQLSDLKSDVEGASHDDDQKRAADVSSLLSDLAENTEKTLAPGKDVS